MPTPYNAALRALRMKYKAASTAHATCLQALTDAKVRGAPPPQELLEQEAKALGVLKQARAELLAAMVLAPGE